MEQNGLKSWFLRKSIFKPHSFWPFLRIKLVILNRSKSFWRPIQFGIAKMTKFHFAYENSLRRFLGGYPPIYLVKSPPYLVQLQPNPCRNVLSDGPREQGRHLAHCQGGEGGGGDIFLDQGLEDFLEEICYINFHSQGSQNL